MATNITGVTMTAPTTTVNLDAGDTFQMSGQILTAGGGGWNESGDMYFEWDQGTGSWETMPSSGSNLTCPTPNPILTLQTTTIQTRTITADASGPTDSYQVRITLIEDDLTTYNTTPVTVNVTEAYVPANYHQKIIVGSIFT